LSVVKCATVGVGLVQGSVSLTTTSCLLVLVSGGLALHTCDHGGLSETVLVMKCDSGCLLTIVTLAHLSLSLSLSIVNIYVVDTFLSCAVFHTCPLPLLLWT